MRLIDADELKVYLQEYLHYEHAIPWVDAQPTAYDVEKVVEELEANAQKMSEAKGNSWDSSDHRYYKAIGTHKAEQIVRKGGV